MISNLVKEPRMKKKSMEVRSSSGEADKGF